MSIRLKTAMITAVVIYAVISSLLICPLTLFGAAPAFPIFGMVFLLQLCKKVS